MKTTFVIKRGTTTAQSVMYEIIAHAPDHSSVVYARTGYIDLKAKEGALVDIPGQNL